MTAAACVTRRVSGSGSHTPSRRTTQSSASGGSGGSGGTAGLITAAIQLASAFMGSGAPGRATGGPVTPGRAYMVGERGPELFVPTSSGRVEAQGGHSGRDIRITINVAGNVAGGAAGQSPDRMQATGRQIARAVRAAVEGAG